MFRNYVRNPESATPVNLAVARFLVSWYLVWFIASTSWERAAAYPILTQSPDMTVYEALYPQVVLESITYLSWLTILVLVAFSIGFYIKYTAFVAASLVAYLGNLRHMVDTSWSTMMPLAVGVFLVFFALYHKQDQLSFDGIRTAVDGGGKSLDARLKSPLSADYRAPPLRFFLVWLGLLYFGSGIAKLIVGGTDWMTAWNLGRRIDHFYQLGYYPDLIQYIPFLDLFLFLGAIGTIVLEIGFIFSIVTGLFFSPFILGLVMFHVAIALFMGPVFIYNIVFYLMYFDWEALGERLNRTENIEVLFDENNTNLMAVLYLFKLFDGKNKIKFISQSSLPREYSSDERIVLKDTMYLRKNNEFFGGFYVIRELCKQNVLLYPLSIICRIPLISWVGVRYYRYVTDSPSTSFPDST